MKHHITCLSCLLVSALTLLLAASSCSDSDGGGALAGPAAGPTPDVEMTLSIEVNIGDGSRGHSSRAVTSATSVTQIDDVLVMLFTEETAGSNTPGRLWRVVRALNLSEDLGDGRHTFDVKIGIDPATAPARLCAVAVANGASLRSLVAPGEGMLWGYDDVVQRLVTTYTARASRAADAPLFTLWGVGEKAIETDRQVQSLRLRMVRDLAHVQVNLDETVWSGQATRLACALVYNRHDDILMMPRRSSLSADFMTVTGVSTPAAPATVTCDPYTALPCLDDYVPLGLYIPEQNVVMRGDGDPADVNRFSRPALIVGLYYRGNADKVYWYRVDFLDGDGKLFDMVRNHDYIVNVTAVNGPGEDTPGEAYLSTTTRVEAEVVPWTDMESNATLDGGNWIAAQRAVTLSGGKGTQASIEVRSNVSPELWEAAWAKPADPFESLSLTSLATVGDDGMADSDGLFSVTMSHDGESATLRFTALSDLSGEADAEARVKVLHVSVTPRLRFVIVVTQGAADDTGMITPWGESNIYGEL